MSLLVVGSIAYDSIKTPHGELHEALGGAAVYFSLAASAFGPVRLVGVVGEDFQESNVNLMRRKGVDVAGLERVAGGRTFRWAGEYSEDMNDRRTLSVELNVFDGFEPTLPEEFRDSRFVFLANASPGTQASVFEQVSDPDFVMADTMDLWIETARKDLLSLLSRIDGISLNDSEALLLTGRHNLIDAGRAILDLGPSTVVVKKGEHGSILFRGDSIIPLPAFPTSSVCDPTGAGDSFAGALMGELTRSASTESGLVDEMTLKRSIAYGSVAASFTCEGFGTERIAAVSAEDIDERFNSYCDSIRVES